MDKVEAYISMMESWQALAADFGQLAVAALVLPIIFLRKIIGIPETESLSKSINNWLYSSWGFLFISIGLSMLYQSVAICLIGQKTGLGTGFGCNDVPPSSVALGFRVQGLM